MVVLEVDRSDAKAIRRAAETAAAAIAEGKAVVLPTDTVYGVAARPDDPVATLRLFEAKRRSHGLNLPVLAGTAAGALALGRPTRYADVLAAAFWPGPLTLVVPRGDTCSGWMLGANRGTIGLRVPDHPVATAVLNEAGPLAVTSANGSGRRRAATVDDLVAALGDTVALYLVEAPSSPLSDRPALASTVLDLTGDEPRRTRRGAVADAQIEDALRTSGAKVEPVDFDP